MRLDACTGFGWSGLLVLGCLTRGGRDSKAKHEDVRAFRGMCVISSAEAVKRLWVILLLDEAESAAVPSGCVFLVESVGMPDGWFLFMVGSTRGFVQYLRCVVRRIERQKGIRWMPWHQEAMKDVARCEKPWGAASRL